ncbi:cytochrome P450 [Leisingera sp. ANG-M6]|uniref:cytochrome P450 n=1 Tax=Leisingera sp. ANG-M6 TaxID=1577900 RepID=UPI00057F59A3|nr:cytochrome P450 [Leisingera sp. ANG-M6]KIC28381.1 hypothetical protein RA24_10660 [Leisingera sp. ANG-M6]
MSLQVPALSLPPLAEIRWTSAADAIRFRPHTRPRELLSQGVVPVPAGRRNIFLISDPGTADRILRRDSKQFPKATPQYRVGYKAFGPGISGTIGETNLRQRKALAPLFEGANLRRAAEAARLAAADAAHRWTGTRVVDLHKESSRLALDVAWSIFLGNGEYEGAAPSVREAIEKIARLPKQDFVEAASVVRELVDTYVDTGRYLSVDDENPMSKIACAAGYSGSPGLSQPEVRANAAVLAASGHVTTGLTLGWGLWVLGQMPAYQAELRDKLERKGSIRPELIALFSEAMRLWTPAAETMRENLVPVSVEGTTIPPKSLILVSYYAMHRRSGLWAEPNKFDITRFSRANLANIPKGAFQPFSGGEYRCPGMSLAWQELIAASETLLRRCTIEVEPASAAEVGLEAGTCIYPDRPLQAKISGVK